MDIEYSGEVEDRIITDLISMVLEEQGVDERLHEIIAIRIITELAALLDGG